MKNIFKKVSNWLFGNKDALSKECEAVYRQLEQKYNIKEKITDKHLSKEEFINSLTDEKKQLLIEKKDEFISKLLDKKRTYYNNKAKNQLNEITNIVEILPEVESAKDYVSKSLLVKGEDKPLEVNTEKAKTIKQNKKRKYTKKK